MPKRNVSVLLVGGHPLPFTGSRASLFRCQLSPGGSDCVGVYLVCGCLEQLLRSEGLLTANRGVMFSGSFFPSKLHSLSSQRHDNAPGSSDLAQGCTSALVLFPLLHNSKRHLFELFIYFERQEIQISCGSAVFLHCNLINKLPVSCVRCWHRGLQCLPLTVCSRLSCEVLHCDGLLYRGCAHFTHNLSNFLNFKEMCWVSGSSQ